MRKVLGIDANGRRAWIVLPEPGELTTEQLSAIVARVPAVDISGKVDKIPGYGLSQENFNEAQKNKLAGIETNANNYSHPSTHPPSIISQDASNRFVNDSEKTTWNGKSTAPNDAQKNSDITDAEIKAKYVTPAYNSVYRTILDSSGSHSAAKAAGTYGMPQGNILAVSGTGTLYALNTIYIAAADYPTIDSKAAKLRVRCVIACNDVAPFTGTFVIGLHPVTRPATSGGAGLCIYTIGAAVAGSTCTGTNLAADSINNLVGADFALPSDGFYVLAVVTSGTMATSSHVHISASLQIHNV